MSLELTTLRLLKHRKRYEALARAVPHRALDTRTQILLKDFGRFFAEFPEAQRIDAGAFTLFFRMIHPKLGEDDLAVYSHLFREFDTDVGADVEQGLMKRLQEAATAYDVATMLDKYNSGEEVDVRAGLTGFIAAYDEQIERTAKNPQVLDPIEDLLRAEANDEGLHWRLGCINRSIKPLVGGDFMVVAARPDRGKTTFLSDNLTFMAPQIDTLYPDQGRSILWFNNEGPGHRIVTRCFQSALGATMEELVRLSGLPAEKGFEKYKTLVRQRYAQALGGRPGVLRIFDIHDFWSHEVEDVIELYNPAVIVLDMVDNIKFSGGASNNGQRTDQLLEEMYKWARNRAVKKDCAVLATSQISAEGDGMPYPTLPMLKDSRCLAPGTMVRMADGGAVAVEDIRVGDRVMGVDSAPRVVLATGTGSEAMYRVSGPAWSFDCNAGHNLTVMNPTGKPTAGLGRGEIRRLSLREFMAHPSYMQRLAAVRVSVEYPEAALPMDPYLFGLWLGAGAQRDCLITTVDSEIAEYLSGLPTFRREDQQQSNCADFYFGPREWLRSMGVWMNKHIPQVFKVSSTAQRRALLAGLMDSDGYVSRDGSSEIAMSRNHVALLRDIQEVAQSLGFRTNWRENEENDSATLTVGVTDALPCLLPRRRGTVKHKHDTMTVSPLGVGVYHGITVDQDHRFVLANYIATENTGKQGAADVILTIGALNDPNLANSRYIATTKNKKSRTGMPSSPNTEVIFRGDIGRYEEAPK